ncbi:MAG: DUF3857 domain-containing protein [Candidatus Zixiibacteriota bacterium]
MNFKRLMLPIFAILLIFSVSILAEKYESMEEVAGDDIVSPEILQMIQEAPEYSEYPDAKALWLMKHEHINMIDEYRYEKDIHYLIRIFSYKGKKAYSNFKFNYDTTFQDIEIIQARSFNQTEDSLVYDIAPIPMHSVNEITPPHLTGAGDYVQRKQMVLSVPAVNESSFIEIKVKVKNTDKPPYPYGGYNVLVDEDPVLDARFGFVPGDVRLHYEYSNGATEPVTPQDTIRWDIKDYGGINAEEGLPPATEFLPTVTVTTQLTWTDEASYFAKKFLPRAIVTDKVRKIASEASSGKGGADKIWAIADWVSEEINKVYMELGEQDYTPNEAEKVIDNGSGDCRDLSILLLAMFKAEGIEAHPVLVNRNGRKIREEIPTIRQFNHVIVRATVDGEYYYIDPYMSNAPHGTLGYLSGEKGLLVKLGGYEFIDFPKKSPEANRLEIKYDIKLDKEGLLKGKLYAKSYGMIDGDMRSKLRDKSPRKMTMIYEDLVSSISAGAELKNDTTGIRDDRDVNLWFEVEFEAEDFASLQKDMMVIEFPGNPVTFASITLPSSIGDREFPYYTDYPAEIFVEYRMDIPEQYRVVYLTQPVEIDNEIGSFKIESREEGRNILLTRDLKISQKMVQPDEYGKFQEILRALRLPKNKLLLLEDKDARKIIRPNPAGKVPTSTRSVNDVPKEK